MGSLCSPDHVEQSSASPNTQPPRNRSKKNNEDSLVSNTDQSANSADISDDVGNQQSGLFAPSIDDIHSNTSRSGLKQVQKDLALSASPEQDKKPFQIVVSPPNKSDTDQQPGSYASIQDGIRPSDSDSPDEEGSANNKSAVEKVDSTLGGVIIWKKVADFSALLPRDVKLKLWNGVFKAESDYKQPEVKRISKVLRTFVMLQLTREYKKTNSTVPNSLKVQLPGAVKEPSKFIASFLKRDETSIDETFLSIHETLCDRFQTDDNAKKAKYAKKLKMTKDNYVALTKSDLQREFNKEDFLKAAFLQYMLYAYQATLDGEN
eukprot:174272_1